MLPCGVFHQPLLWAVLTHIPNFLRLWQGQMCFLDQETILYHTLLSPKARLWPTLITLLFWSTHPKKPQSLFALFNPPALYFTTYSLQNLCISPLSFVGCSFSPTPSSPPISWNPAPTEDAPAPVLLLPRFCFSHSTVWGCVGDAQLSFCGGAAPRAAPQLGPSPSPCPPSWLQAGTALPCTLAPIPQALGATSKAETP